MAAMAAAPIARMAGSAPMAASEACTAGLEECTAAAACMAQAMAEVACTAEDTEGTAAACTAKDPWVRACMSGGHSCCCGTAAARAAGLQACWPLMINTPTAPAASRHRLHLCRPLGPQRPSPPAAAAQRVAGDAGRSVGRGPLLWPPVLPGGRERARRALFHLSAAAAAGPVRMPRGGRGEPAARGGVATGAETEEGAARWPRLHAVADPRMTPPLPAPQVWVAVRRAGSLCAAPAGIQASRQEGRGAAAGTAWVAAAAAGAAGCGADAADAAAAAGGHGAGAACGQAAWPAGPSGRRAGTAGSGGRAVEQPVAQGRLSFE